MQQRLIALETVNLQAGNSDDEQIAVAGNVSGAEYTSDCPRTFVTGAAPDLKLHYTNPNGLLHNQKHPVLHIDPGADTYINVVQGNGFGYFCYHSLTIPAAPYGDYYIWIESQAAAFRSFDDDV